MVKEFEQKLAKSQKMAENLELKANREKNLLNEQLDKMKKDFAAMQNDWTCATKRIQCQLDEEASAASQARKDYS